MFRIRRLTLSCAHETTYCLSSTASLAHYNPIYFGQQLSD